MNKATTLIMLGLLLLSATVSAEITLTEYDNADSQLFHDDFNGTTWNPNGDWGTDGSSFPKQNDNVTLKGTGAQWNDNLTWINTNYSTDATTAFAVKWRRNYTGGNKRVMVCLIDSEEHWSDMGGGVFNKMDFCMYDGQAGTVQIYEEGSMMANPSFAQSDHVNYWYMFNITEGNNITYYAKLDDSSSWTYIYSSTQSFGNYVTLLLDVGTDSGPSGLGKGNYTFDDVQVWNYISNNAPVIQTINCASNPNGDLGVENRWNSSGDITPTFNVTTDINSNGAISNDNSTWIDCSNPGGKSHICTLPDSQKLNERDNWVYLKFNNSGGNTTYRNITAWTYDSGMSIQEGIDGSKASGATVYTDHQVYERLTNGSQALGRFDRVALLGNQRWAFNYVPSNESFLNMWNITPAFYIREFEQTNATETRLTVEEIINETKT